MHLAKFTKSCIVAACCLMALAVTAVATDRDGPNDCLRQLNDWGDAPEGILAYPAGPIGQFPTCSGAGAVIGTQTVSPGCPPRSTPPGATGYVIHTQPGGNNYWLGCYFTPGAGPFGIDSDVDGVVHNPPSPTSFCSTAQPTDCVETLGLSWSQDECYTDGSDAGVTSPPGFVACTPSTITFDTYACATQQAFLNICVDMNADADWNDNFLCGASCAHEWAVKNVTITIPAGCATITSPPFLIGPIPGPTWFRISISSEPMLDDYPWNGTVSFPGHAVRGGETEDYPARIDEPTSARYGTWGRIKQIYR